MAKDKRVGETISNLDWDSPPNNKFQPWPIAPKPNTGGGQGARREQQGGDSTQEQRRDCTHEQQQR
jgi:hypothetical protein